jgi:hypothetical protein
VWADVRGVALTRLVLDPVRVYVMPGVEVDEAGMNTGIVAALITVGVTA